VLDPLVDSETKLGYETRIDKYRPSAAETRQLSIHGCIYASLYLSILVSYPAICAPPNYTYARQEATSNTSK